MEVQDPGFDETSTAMVVKTGRRGKGSMIALHPVLM